MLLILALQLFFYCSNKATTADLKEFLPNDLHGFCERQNFLAPLQKVKVAPAPVVAASNGGKLSPKIGV